MQKIITLIIFFALQLSFAQTASEYNSGATSAFNAGNYSQAKEYFELAIKLNNNAKTNYNLANTCEKLGEIGAAKAYYMRAIYQDPRLKEAVFNLEALDKKYALKSFNTSNADLFFDELSHNEWIVISAVSLWFAVVLLVVLPFLKLRKPWQLFLGLVFLCIFALGAFGVMYWNSFSSTAVALKDNASLKLSPSQDSGIACTLKQGQMLSIKKQKGEFYLLESSGKKGWANLKDKDFLAVKI